MSEKTGTVIKILQKEKGSGSKGNWEKIGFVIETKDQYPKKIYFEAWGDKVKYVEGLRPGDEAKVNYNLESREYNNRWYTEARAWKIELVSTGQGNTQPKPPAAEEEDLPF